MNDVPASLKLEDISPRAYEHPADRAATAALRSIPMLDTVVRKLVDSSTSERCVRPCWPARSGSARTSCRTYGPSTRAG